MIIFFIAVSQKSTLLFQRFVNEIGACWYGQMQTCHSPAFVWGPLPPPRLPPTAPSPHCLMLWGWGGGGNFYVLLSKCCVYIAEGGPLCVPLQISRSKRGKHGYINKRSLLTGLSLAPVTHLGFNHRSEWRENVEYWSWVNSHQQLHVINSAFNDEKAT